MTTIIDLMREYVRVADMCKGTDVKPWECVKYEGRSHDLGHPTFLGLPENYTFALTILEDKPVFVGDTIWLKNAEIWITVINANPSYIDPELCSWTPPTPKRTFVLNGVELPCPVITRGRIQSDRHIRSIEFEFDSAEEGDTFITRLNELLTEARDKE